MQTDERTDGHGLNDPTRQADTYEYVCIYFIGSLTLPSGYSNFVANLICMFTYTYIWNVTGYMMKNIFKSSIKNYFNIYVWLKVTIYIEDIAYVEENIKIKEGLLVSSHCLKVFKSM